MANLVCTYVRWWLYLWCVATDTNVSSTKLAWSRIQHSVCCRLNELRCVCLSLSLSSTQLDLWAWPGRFWRRIRSHSLYWTATSSATTPSRRCWSNIAHTAEKEPSWLVCVCVCALMYIYMCVSLCVCVCVCVMCVLCMLECIPLPYTWNVMLCSVHLFVWWVMC